MTTPALQGADWVFFDLGSTLLDETKCLQTRFARAATLAAGFGAIVTPEELWASAEAAYAAFSPSPFREALARLPLTQDQQQTVYDGSPYESAGEMLYAGVADLLGHLSQSHALGVLTNQAPGLPARLRFHGIDGYFGWVLGSGDLGVGKPTPEIYQMASREAGPPPESLVMVGDRIDNDIRPANDLGWRTVRVRQGIAHGQAPRRESEVADYDIDSIQLLTDLI